MSDEERLQRLTELARRVWPDRGAVVRTSDDPEEHGACVVLDEEGEWEQHLGVTHPCSLDALEAALLVLAAGGRITPQVQAAHDALVGEPPAWVEELASEWDERVRQRREYPLAEADVEIGCCAAELRERARQR